MLLELLAANPTTDPKVLAHLQGMSNRAVWVALASNPAVEAPFAGELHPRMTWAHRGPTTLAAFAAYLTRPGITLPGVRGLLSAANLSSEDLHDLVALLPLRSTARLEVHRRLSHADNRKDVLKPGTRMRFMTEPGLAPAVRSRYVRATRHRWAPQLEEATAYALALLPAADRARCQRALGSRLATPEWYLRAAAHGAGPLPEAVVDILLRPAGLVPQAPVVAEVTGSPRAARVALGEAAPSTDTLRMLAEHPYLPTEIRTTALERWAPAGSDLWTDPVIDALQLAPTAVAERVLVNGAGADIKRGHPVLERPDISAEVIDAVWQATLHPAMVANLSPFGMPSTPAMWVSALWAVTHPAATTATRRTIAATVAEMPRALRANVGASFVRTVADEPNVAPVDVVPVPVLLLDGLRPWLAPASDSVRDWLATADLRLDADQVRVLFHLLGEFSGTLPQLFETVRNITG